MGGKSTARRLMLVFGTRPEVIKLAPVFSELRRRARFRVRTCFTAQHREMCDPLLRFFSIEPDHDLDIMTENQSLAEIATRTMDRLDAVLARERPDLVIVQGDTTSAAAAALCAFYRKIPAAHVEAGLRTHNILNPYPEEMNRQIIGRVARLHFAPTERARRALTGEGVPPQHVWVTGNTVIDALYFTRAKVAGRRSRGGGRPRPERRRILVTAHRRESFGRGMEEICASLRDLVDRNGDIEIFFPVHPNPSVRAPVKRMLASRSRIILVDPVEYMDLVRIMDASDIVLTDSGGLQEEAPALGKPVVVMRDETERPEIVEAGGAVLAGPHRDRIVSAVERILSDGRVRRRMARVRTPFGDGRAAARIGRIIDAWFRSKQGMTGAFRRSVEFRP